MKVLYTLVDDVSGRLKSDGAGVEDLYIPSTALEMLRSALDSSNNRLPTKAQALQTWQVGLLQRFNPKARK
jgi:hypothetical protein